MEKNTDHTRNSTYSIVRGFCILKGPSLEKKRASCVSRSFLRPRVCISTPGCFPPRFTYCDCDSDSDFACTGTGTGYTRRAWKYGGSNGGVSYTGSKPLCARRVTAKRVFHAFTQTSQLRRPFLRRPSLCVLSMQSVKRFQDYTPLCDVFHAARTRRFAVCACHKHAPRHVAF